MERESALMLVAGLFVGLMLGSFATQYALTPSPDPTAPAIYHYEMMCDRTTIHFRAPRTDVTELPQGPGRSNSLHTGEGTTGYWAINRVEGAGCTTVRNLGLDLMSEDP